jgi:hypothetical protein
VVALLCPVVVPMGSLLLHLTTLLIYDFETGSLPAALIPNIIYNILLLGKSVLLPSLIIEKFTF